MPDQNSPQQPLQAAEPNAAQTGMQNAVSQPVQAKGTSGMGIASLVLGILAILSSFLPIINNGSFLIALLGLVFAVVGIIATRKGKKGGRGIAIAGLVLNILSIAIVLATQSIYSAAIDEVTEELESGSKPVATKQAQEAADTTANAEIETEAKGAQAPALEPKEEEQGSETDNATQEQNAPAPEEPAATEETAEADYSNLSLGEAVEMKDGLVISVDGVTRGLADYSGDPVTAITVTYTNNGDKNQSFNGWDWKAQDVNGIVNTMTFFMDSENELGSGELTPGSTITGNIYFDGDLAKAYYYSNIIFQSDSDIAWNLQ